MKLYLHDEDTSGDKHGERGPTHCVTITVEYPHQVEMWVQEVEQDYPGIVRAECPELSREWFRDSSGTFVEVPRLPDFDFSS